MNEKVSVVGLGKLGLCWAAVLADAGFETTGVDINAQAVDAINRGESPIQETGLAELISRHGGNALRATTDHREAIEKTDITFVLVATPSYSDGRFSNEFAEAAFRDLGIALRTSKKPFHTFVVSCTVMPGSTDDVFVPTLEKHSERKLNEGFGVCYDPEFVALGNVIKNYRNPDVVVLGQSAPAVGDHVELIHHRICHNQPRICRMSIISAEVAKVSLNVFITMKVSFGNMLANLCEAIPGADVDQITQAIGGDKRISPHYLRGGLPYGGPCFPRDTRAFLALAKSSDGRAELIEATESVNVRQLDRLVSKISEAAENDKSKEVGILGLAFKSDTPVITESPAIQLISRLLADGYRVIAFDTKAMASSRELFGSKIRFATSAAECLSNSSVCVLANQDSEYKAAIENYSDVDRKTIVDCWRILNRETVRSTLSVLRLGEATEAKRPHESTVTSAQGPRANILGVGVSVVNMTSAISRIEDWISRREQQFVVCAPVHGLIDCHRDAKLREIYNRAGMVIPDGMPVVWICRMIGHKNMDRVSGPDLMAELCRISPVSGYKHFLYGGWPPHVVDKLATQLEKNFQGIKIVGTYAPPYRPLSAEEDAEVVEKINAADPDVVWIGLGTSKEKFWAASHVGKLNASVLVGVGAAFDFHAGTKRRAPFWMQRAGLEWFFRFVNEPRRLGPRYLKDNSAFLYLVARQLIGKMATVR